MKRSQWPCWNACAEVFARRNLVGTRTGAGWSFVELDFQNHAEIEHGPLHRPLQMVPCRWRVLILFSICTDRFGMFPSVPSIAFHNGPALPLLKEVGLEQHRLGQRLSRLVAFEKESEKSRRAGGAGAPQSHDGRSYHDGYKVYSMHVVFSSLSALVT